MTWANLVCTESPSLKFHFHSLTGELFARVDWSEKVTLLPIQAGDEFLKSGEAPATLMAVFWIVSKQNSLFKI